jgi:hypothetical protein
MLIPAKSGDFFCENQEKCSAESAPEATQKTLTKNGNQQALILNN